MEFVHSASVVSVALRALVVLLLLVGIAIDFALQMPTGRRSEGAGPGTHASVSDVAFSDGSTRRLLYIAPVAQVADLAAAYAPRALVILLLGTLVVAGLLIARRPAQRLRASAGRIVSLPAFRARRRVSVAATRPTPLIGIVSSEEPSLDALEAL